MMPLLTKINERASSVFSSENIDSLDKETILDFDDLVGLALHLGVAKTGPEEEFLRQWPDTLLGAVLAVIKTAVAAEPRTPISFSWAPDYDFNVGIWDAHSTSTSVRGVTVVLRSRYPE